jgi:hypothetical protein
MDEHENELQKEQSVVKLSSDMADYALTVTDVVIKN